MLILLIQSLISLLLPVSLSGRRLISNRMRLRVNLFDSPSLYLTLFIFLFFLLSLNLLSRALAIIPPRSCIYLTDVSLPSVVH